MVRSAKVTPGPVGKGTQFRSAVRSRGRLAEMAIEYTGFQRPSRLVPATRMAQAEFSGTLAFEPAGAGTRLRWSWDARFTWPLRVLAPVLARVGGRQERATWAGLKRYLESSQHAAGPGAGEQPGPAPAAAADGNGSRPPGQGRAGAALLAASVAGVALAPLALSPPVSTSTRCDRLPGQRSAYSSATCPPNQWPSTAGSRACAAARRRRRSGSRSSWMRRECPASARRN